MAWPPAFVCRRIALVAFGVSLLLYLVLTGLLYAAGLDIRTVLIGAQLVALLGFSLWLARLLRLPMVEAFALRPAARPHWIMVGAAALPLQVLGGGLQFAILRSLPEDSPVRRLMEETLGRFVAVEGPLDLLLLFAAAVLVAAVCEEFLFRGLILQLWRRRAGWGSAIVGSAALFAVYHLNPVVLVPVGLVGAYLALLVWRSGSLYPAIAAHALNNGLALFGLPLLVDEAAYARWLVVTLSASGLAFGAVLVVYLRNTTPPPDPDADAETPDADAGTPPPDVDITPGSPGPSPGSSPEPTVGEAPPSGPGAGAGTPPAAGGPGGLERDRVDGGLGDGEQAEHPE